VTEYGDDKEGLKKYFDSSEWKEQLKSFQDSPEYKSNESLMLNHAAEIKKYTYEIGQWHLDKKMPLMDKKLNEMWEKAREHGNTTDTGPGEHGDPSGGKPFPTEQPAPEQRPPTVAEATNNMREVLANPASTPEDIKNARLSRNDALEAEVNRLDRVEEVERKTKDATRFLFSEYGGGPLGFLQRIENERPEMNAINDTVKAAAKSGNLTEFNAAKEFADIISRYGASDDAGKPYDRDNTFNSLAQFTGDILGMLNALRALVDRIDGVEVNVTTER
jgi:hypothetical protein